MTSQIFHTFADFSFFFPFLFQVLPTGKPCVVCILDGFGENKHKDEFNAVHSARTPNVDKLRANAERCRFVQAHGTWVGLPSDDDMGNSEVGHNAIGSGKGKLHALPKCPNTIFHYYFFFFFFFFFLSLSLSPALSPSLFLQSSNSFSPPFFPPPFFFWDFNTTTKTQCTSKEQAWLMPLWSLATCLKARVSPT